ncbi:hypothetical protein [Parasphingorhabdus litoris]|nr:hypothetical protein [Parasphingorhabdus litoris]
MTRRAMARSSNRRYACLFLTATAGVICVNFGSRGAWKNGV